MEKVSRQKSSKHNLYLGFKYRWQPHSIEPRPLRFIYNYSNTNTKRKVTPISIPMLVWDKKKQQIKDEYQKDYKEYVKLINEYKTEIPQILLDLTDNKISYVDAFNKLLNIVEDGYILDKFQDFCKLRKKSRNAINKQTDYINAVQSFFNEIAEIEYSRLKWSHLTQDKHIRRIETLIREKLCVKNETKNSYLGALNYACKVNPNTNQIPFQDKFKLSDEIQEDKHLLRESLEGGISKIGNNLQWLEAYLFWLLSFSLRGLDGADICLMEDGWLVDEKGKKVKSSNVKHYLPNYNELVNRQGLHNIKAPKKILDMLPKFDASNKKVYIRGYRTKPSEYKIGIKILFNHYPTLIIHRLLKHCISINRPHLLFKGDDTTKLYNIDYHTDKGKAQWKVLLNTYTKQCQKMFGDNGNIKNTRHTFTTELGQIMGEQRSQLLSTSLGHRSQRVLGRYIKQDQTKLDIYHLEVVKSYDINKVVKLLIEWCSKQMIEISGRKLQMIRTEGVSPIVSNYEREALEIPLTYWSPIKEYEYQRLMKKEDRQSLISFDDKGKEIYEKAEFTKELKALIEQRNEMIKSSRIKRKVTGYDRKSNKVTTKEI